MLFDSQITEKNQPCSTYCQKENGGGGWWGINRLFPNCKTYIFDEDDYNQTFLEKKHSIVFIKNWIIHKCDYIATDDIKGHSVIFSIPMSILFPQILSPDSPISLFKMEQ